MSPRPPERRKLVGASGLNLLLGAIVFLSPFLTTTSQAAFWGAIVIGGLIVALELYALWAETQAKPRAHISSAETVNLLAGLTLMAFAVFVRASTGYTWTNFLAGMVVTGAAVYNLVITNQRPTRRTA